ncbi:hypothetical protein NIES3275_15250 [Microchaete diplosiphon NIES-3275]|nr:hypothetical protein NIES3275_15250 [Microchaete diplosiphon NIES-3275]
MTELNIKAKFPSLVGVGFFYVVQHSLYEQYGSIRLG